MKPLLAMYSPLVVRTLVYMLQSSEYNLLEYLSWLHRTVNFSKVTRRRKLVLTRKAQLLLAGGLLAYAALVLLAGWSVVQGGFRALAGLGLLVGLPYILAYSLIVPLIIGQLLIQKPRERRLIDAAEKRLRSQHCHKVAIAGSYGKTTFKETLATILSEGLHVAASPGNMNTPLGLANFIQKLDGSEDVLIFELGEEKPGDVKRLCELTRPNMGVITGISEAHLSSFGSIEAVTSTIFELSDYLKSYDVYKNGENECIVGAVSVRDQHLYSEKGVNGWKVSDISTGLQGTSFVATKHNKTVWADSGLLGRHQVGQLTACIDIADKFGLSVAKIAEGIKRTKPFEHRMQPRELYGAVIIDDTYNGNSKGIEAGLEFLETVPAVRKIFVTPGLVEQGEAADMIHESIGVRAAGVADIIVLMNNSTTAAIQRGIERADFAGEVKIVDNPLDFYSNLKHFVAAGDVVLMQNDWTDNYA